MELYQRHDQYAFNGVKIMNMALAVDQDLPRTAATGGSNVVRARGDRSSIRVVNGRLVSLTLHDPEVKREIAESMAELRRDPAKLRAYYVKQGLLTPGGKLTKRYGG